jgi:hypothetical protein
MWMMYGNEMVDGGHGWMMAWMLERKTAETTNDPSGWISTFTAVARVRIPLGVLHRWFSG